MRTIDKSIKAVETLLDLTRTQPQLNGYAIWKSQVKPIISRHEFLEEYDVSDDIAVKLSNEGLRKQLRKIYVALVRQA